MSVSPKKFPLFLILALFPLLPLFEGGESAGGLFLFHSITFVAILATIFTTSRIHLPKFLIYFLPFLLALLISTFVAPYKYAAFLQLWDYCIAALFAVAVFSALKENQPDVENACVYGFFLGSASTLISVLMDASWFRARGGFLSPNDFAAFILLLFILGLFIYERRSATWQKVAILGLLVLLGVCMARAYSRAIFVATAVLLGLSLLKRKPPRIIAVSLGAVVMLVGGGVLLRFMHITDPFQYYRMKIWTSLLRSVAENPYLGLGLNMLQYSGLKYNFPSDQELGRFALVPRAADNQYLQILTESGFLGFLTFLTGWIMLYLSLAKTPDRFFYLKSSFLVFSVIALFALPLNTTSLLFLFLFLIVVPHVFASEKLSYSVRMGAIGRIAAIVLLFMLFSFAVFLPYASIREFRASVASTSPQEAREHFNKAVRYNPYQPYYRFVYLRPLVDAKKQLDQAGLLHLLELIEESIALHPVEPQFYLYRARVYQMLLEQTNNLEFYSRTISSYQAAMGVSPYDVFVRYEYASFLLRYGRFDIAEGELRKVIEMEPAFLNARLLLSELHFRQKRVAEAQAQFAEQEKYFGKYYRFRELRHEGYIKQLLNVDLQYREKIRELLFDSPNSQPAGNL